jgi:hypothetical protein
MLLDPWFIKMFDLKFLNKQAQLLLSEGADRESGMHDIEDMQASADPN